MWIAGCRILNKFIEENNDNTFIAKYKGSSISVSTNHGHGEPKEKHLKRYDIDVRAKDGTFEVNTFEDFPNIRTAIIYALNGAGLILTDDVQNSQAQK